MGGYVENGYVSGGHCFINNHALSEANKLSSLYFTNKRGTLYLKQINLVPYILQIKWV